MGYDYLHHNMVHSNIQRAETACVVSSILSCNPGPHPNCPIYAVLCCVESISEVAKTWDYVARKELEMLRRQNKLGLTFFRQGLDQQMQSLPGPLDIVGRSSLHL